MFAVQMKGLGVTIMAAPIARERQPIHICEMMQRLSIEPGGGVAPSLGLSYATAFHRCEACPSKQGCRDWLDSMPASVAFAPRFCPNATSSLNRRLINLARGLSVSSRVIVVHCIMISGVTSYGANSSR